MFYRVIIGVSIIGIKYVLLIMFYFIIILLFFKYFYLYLEFEVFNLKCFYDKL